MWSRDSICKLKSGRGEKRESRRQNNSTPDFEGSVWHVKYAQLSIRKSPEPINKRCEPWWRQEATECFEMHPQWACAAGTTAHGTVFPKGSLSLRKFGSKLFHSCCAVGSENHWARSSVLNVELHSPCVMRAQKLLFSFALFFFPFAVVRGKGGECIGSAWAVCMGVQVSPGCRVRETPGPQWVGGSIHLD